MHGLCSRIEHGMISPRGDVGIMEESIDAKAAMMKYLEMYVYILMQSERNCSEVI